MFLTDTHCHLNKEYFPDGLDTVFANAKANDVKRMIFASADIASSKEAAALASVQKADPEIFALAGVHPHEAKNVSQDYLAEIENITKNERVPAIGEIGLDYFYDLSDRAVQRRVFAEQLELAKKISMPIVIHVRDAKIKSEGDATADLFAIMRECGAEKNGGVIHCFSGSAEEANKALEMGFYISFAGPVTYPANRLLRETAANIPIDRILCETDSPYLAPQGHRGKPNEPAFVRCVYEYISMVRAMPLEEFADAVKSNTERVFKIK